RLRRFGLELHPDKTRRIEFGRFGRDDARCLGRLRGLVPSARIRLHDSGNLGRPIRAGQSFGAAYVIGYFDSIPEMEKVYDQYRGANTIVVGKDGWRAPR